LGELARGDDRSRRCNVCWRPSSRLDRQAVARLPWRIGGKAAGANPPTGRPATGMNERTRETLRLGTSRIVCLVSRADKFAVCSCAATRPEIKCASSQTPPTKRSRSWSTNTSNAAALYATTVAAECLFARYASRASSPPPTASLAENADRRCGRGEKRAPEGGQGLS
jgi:hypothetical protein